MKVLTSEVFDKDNNETSSTSLFYNVMVGCLELFEKGSRSKKHHDVAIQAVRKTIVLDIGRFIPLLIFWWKQMYKFMLTPLLHVSQ